MKFVVLALLVSGVLGCSREAGSGGTDFASTDGDILYHDLSTDSLSGAAPFSYTKIEIRADGTFTQEEYLSEDGVSGKRCSLSGNWDLPAVDPTAPFGNELVLTVSALNGGASSSIIKYDLKVLAYDTLKVRFPDETSDRDLTNQVYVTDYPELQGVNLSGFTPEAFCDR